MAERTTRSVPLLIAISTITAILVAGAAVAQELRLIRIGTGSTGGTYFPVGGLIASAISNPPGSRACEVGGSCGVPGLIAAAVSTQGSVQNVTDVAAGTLDLALTQADVAYAAYLGKGAFAGERRLGNLRAIANLFPEAVHVVAGRESGIETVADLRGKRVSLGEKESGTLVVAEIVLGAYGMGRSDVVAFHEKLGKAGDMLAAGEIDAYFMVGGYPIHAIAHTADTFEIDLVPITGEAAEAIRAERPFFGEAVIPGDTYRGVDGTATLSVGAQLVVAASTDADLVFGITKALWHPSNRKILDSGHPNGKQIEVARALDGIAIPLHPGAAHYYERAGLIPPDVF
ncbi:MAG: TAXI family TRAP transporter solute-binding subunit [Rhodospirillales bacterium]